ncbi:hypothetical protein Tco_0528082 [Tanacetum coccineum]
MHPGRLHGQMRKKLSCVKVGFTYPKTADLEGGAGDEDYYNRALLDYEAETGVPFKLRHCWEVLKGSPKWMKIEVPKCLAKSGEGSMKKKGQRASGSSSMNDDALARLMVSDMAMHNERVIEMQKEERKAFLDIKRREVEYRE